MNSTCVAEAYEFDSHQNELTLMPVSRLFSLVDINNAKQLINYIKKNYVSTFVFDISQIKKLDANTESMLYQIAQYFSVDPQKSLLVKSDGDSNLQSKLLNNLYKLNNKIQFEFIATK
jgi:hypothetical protein